MTLMAMKKPVAVQPEKKRPRKLGQLAEHTQRTDRAEWWRAWKAADEEIIAEFEAAAARPFPEARSRRRAR